jgi:hypothetical protein
MKVLQKDVFPAPELPMRSYIPRGISPSIKKLAPGKTSVETIFITHAPSQITRDSFISVLLLLYFNLRARQLVAKL